MLDDTAAYCAERGLPMLVHLGGTQERGDYRFLPERHPKTSIIYAHAGVPHYSRIWDYVRAKDNVFVDLSGPYCDEPMRRAAVRDLGPDKCIYGTDGPYGYPGTDGLYDHGAILEEIERLPISDSNKEKVVAGNFMELVGGQEG
jgi:predicted TIM-barrel fold metal-dependent hydrolase